MQSLQYRLLISFVCILVVTKAGSFSGRTAAKPNQATVPSVSRDAPKEQQTNLTTNIVGDPSKKQGAYGKVNVHKEPYITQLLRLDEVFAALTLLYIRPLQSNLDSPYIKQQFSGTAASAAANDLAFCNDILVKVSRSFAAVIQQLPSTLLLDILVFYLVLRALDTIEDDTSIESSVKIQMLQDFDVNALGLQSNHSDYQWSLDGVGDGDERVLLQNFNKVYSVYRRLQPLSQNVIADITRRMAFGMAEFVDKDLGQGTLDLDEYNRYCHFVAGLVGEGLSRLFAASGLEDASFAQEEHLSNQMGLFLQKTNIIRDYLEDYVDGRAFWPQSIWKKYSATGDLGYFTNQTDPVVKERSLQCLNELVTDALELVPDCLTYMKRLRCYEIFRFCAIPQVMAIATLEKCFANRDVFTGVVKIRKGLSCKLISRTQTLAQVHEIFFHFARRVRAKALQLRGDPCQERTCAVCDTICALTRSSALQLGLVRSVRMLAVAVLVTALFSPYRQASVILGLVFWVFAVALENKFSASITKKARIMEQANSVVPVAA